MSAQKKYREVNSSNGLFDNLATLDQYEQISHGVIKPKTVYNWISKDELPKTCFVKIKNRIMLRRKEFEAWLLKE